MAITNGWGQAHVNNTIGFGQGAANSTNGYGSIYDESWSGDTNIKGISNVAIEFENRVVIDGGTVEAIVCVSNGLN
tara:strand:- start:869 stop:1096 length:228 start_codon:yes stop_codon:yes gene_type:complete